MMRVLAGDNIDRALKVLDRIALALEDANELERQRQKTEESIRRGRARV